MMVLRDSHENNNVHKLKPTARNTLNDIKRLCAQTGQQSYESFHTFRRRAGGVLFKCSALSFSRTPSARQDGNDKSAKLQTSGNGVVQLVGHPATSTGAWARPACMSTSQHYTRPAISSILHESTRYEREDRSQLNAVLNRCALKRSSAPCELVPASS
jgi:hypothetical protein